jgi:quinoprotein glucose dehydrogenase
MRTRPAGLWLGALVVAAALLARRPAPETRQDEALPDLGTRLGQFPPGPMKAVADQACLNCHSADMTLQQRLNDKQWTAEIEKMVGWGAVVPEDQKAPLTAYLVEHFGPDNDRFQPVPAAPAGR